MMKIIFVVIAMLSYTSFASAQTNKCAALFDQVPVSSVDGTIEDLAALRIKLDTAKAQGLSSVELTALENDYKKKSKSFYKYIRQNDLLTNDQFRERLTQEILKIQSQSPQQRKQTPEEKKEEDRIREEQERQVQQQSIDGTLIFMQRVEPGSFMMGKPGEQVHVILTKPFDMMATLTTQIIWKTVARLANSKLPNVKLPIDPSSFKGATNPVEMISYRDIQIWIESLNELSKMGEPELKNLIPDHKIGDTYRLPTEAEWEFVIRGRGTLNEDYSFGNNAALLTRYAWNSENSIHTTHPVARLTPLVIDGKNFYDMHGNLAEWVFDRYAEKLSGGIDPRPTPEGDEYVTVRNGGWNEDEEWQKSYFRNFYKPTISRADAGFRLVREIKDESSNFSKTNVEGTIKDLAGLKINLDIAKAKGQYSVELTALENDFNKKSLAFYKFIRKNNLMSKDQFLEGMKLAIFDMQKQIDVKRKRDIVANKIQKEEFRNSAIDGYFAILHRIRPGEFKMGELDKKVDVTITEPFDMMATQTTQIIWKKVVELAQKNLYQPKFSHELDSDPSVHKGDTLPVQQVSYNDVQEWLKLLNELSQAGVDLSEIIPSHKKGDVYRLPTDAEWEFVIRGRGDLNGAYSFGNNVNALGDYAWFTDNSKRKIQPVALKLPLVIDGKKFYDLHGNIREWVQDWYSFILTGGTDPQGPPEGSNRVIRNSHWDANPIAMRSGKRDYLAPDSKGPSVGFRFIRVVKPDSANFSSQVNVDGLIKDLAGLKINLDTAKAKGVSSVEFTALENDYKKKSIEFYKYVRKNNLMTKDQFLDRMKLEIANMQNQMLTQKKESDDSKKDERAIHKNQADQVKNAQIHGERAILHRVEPGSFKIGNDKEVIIDKPFELMATPTTQIIWKRIAELNEQKLGGKYKIDPDPSFVKGATHPVEMISYDNLEEWFGALNELSKIGEPALENIIRDHKQGDVYRLPTNDEWEFVMRARGQFKGSYPFGNQVRLVPLYGWYKENSKAQTQPVASLKPIIVDNKEFYDMQGNVSEWVEDLGRPYDGYQIIRGGSWNDTDLALRISNHPAEATLVRSNTIGFRFVREIRENP